MNLRYAVATITMVCVGVVLSSGDALGQTEKQLVGSWTFVSVELTRSDGSKSQPFGPSPKGHVIFDEKGRFAYLLTRPGRAKFAANNREQGTPEENKETVQGTLAYSGRYSVTDGGKTLIFHVEASSYPNAEGVDQKRNITVTAEELKWTNPAPTAAGGGTAQVVLRRAN